MSVSWPLVPPSAGETTGRFLVLLSEDKPKAGVTALQKAAGVTLTRSADSDTPSPAVDDGDGVVFDELGVAVVAAAPDRAEALGAAVSDESNPVLAVEAERVVHALDGSGLSADYLQGYRDAVDHLNELASGRAGGAAPGRAAVAAVDESVSTWGLQAVRGDISTWSGAGVKVAVLDTGMDLGHPDFALRAIVSQSFVTGQAVQDAHSHGTHCIGTACGPDTPGTPPRYGLAHEAEIHAGKVLSNQGSGSDQGILGGIDWAVANGCAIVSMSLGARVTVGTPYSRVFERAASRARRKGTVIIAAAGNDSQRQNGVVVPVSHPANCPSIMAVAALDSSLGVAWFSNGGLVPSGGKIDIAGPGVDVLSSVPVPARYGRKSGTSMATPHVAGVAALHAQADPAARGAALVVRLLQTAQPLAAPSSDVGAGLVQAP